MKKTLSILVLLFAIILAVPAAWAETALGASQREESGVTCLAYFTGIGCPHCAKADPVVLQQLLQKHPSTIIIEFEIYKERNNAPLIELYNSRYGSGYGIPLAVFSKDNHVVGDTPIIGNINSIVTSLKNNSCPLPSSHVAFEALDLAKMPGKPKIWADGRILIKDTGSTANSRQLKKLLFRDYNIQSILSGLQYTEITPIAVELSGKTVSFKKAVRVEGWIFEWNDENTGATGFNEKFVSSEEQGTAVMPTLTLAKIVPLAVVDAINPCALAVLTLMLIAIVTYSPGDKKKILLAGLGFTFSVFVMYAFYGLVIINVFKSIQALAGVKLVLYEVIGFGAIALGLLNIKDFFHYKPGGFATEMPMSLRPTVKKITSGVTSPVGAVVVGALVTLFLLPCTIGPYLIAGGILSETPLTTTVPLLLVYNTIFVSPMIAITLAVYAGLTRIKNVKEWKDKNIRYIHLAAGLIILLLGITMVLGWV